LGVGGFRIERGDIVTTNICYRSAAILLLFLLTACRNHPWYLVESSYDVRGLPQLQRKITSTPAHRALPEKLVVAVRAPDRCANRSAAETTGEATPTGDLLRMDCGVEMAALERALAESGYRVISWSAIEQIVVRQAGITPLAAAKNLNADVLFQINSLERSEANRRHEENWSDQFYTSDKYGNRGAPAEVPEERARVLEAWGRPQGQHIRSGQQVSVTANVTATLVTTGESIWFYERTVVEEPLEATVPTVRLLECHEEILSRCFLRQPQTTTRLAPSPAVSAPPLRSGGYGGSIGSHRAASEHDAVYYKLIGAIVEDLVREFGER
jgi:hypothetical protein